MQNRENGEIKLLKIRVPTELLVQLEEDAKCHHVKPATHARHILCDHLMRTPFNAAAKARVKKLIEEGWAKVGGIAK